jgi:beta-aspartyl-dipeptidase (metallo-type)
MLELLLNGEIYTPEPLGRANMLIAGGRVAWIGPDRLDLPAALEARVTDLEGCRIIPGLVDGHLHVTGGGGEAGFESRLGPITAEEILLAGVTSVVGLLGIDDITRGTAGLLATTRGLCRQGVAAWCLTGGYHLPPATLTGSVRGDIVHIDRVLGAGEIALSDHRSSGPTVDELIRVAGDAYVGGMLAGKAGITHLHLGDGGEGLKPVNDLLDRSEIPARVIQPTHVNRTRALFEEALMLARRGCPIDVTAFPTGEDEDGWDAPEAVGRALDSGLPPDRITVSSDAGGSLPDFDADGRLTGYERQSPASLGRALEGLIRSGRPLEAFLPVFTSNPARVLSLQAKGRLRAGADADLAVLGAGGGIDAVMSGGRWRVWDRQAVRDERQGSRRPAGAVG